LVEEIQQVKQRLDAIGNESPVEWRRLYLAELAPREMALVRLRKATTPDEIAPPGRGLAEALLRRGGVTLPPADTALDELTRWVMGRCGFVEEGVRRRPILSPAVSHVIGAADPPERPRRAALMVAAWREYTQGPTRWSPKNFFVQGHWQSPASWPREQRVFDPCATIERRVLA